MSIAQQDGCERPSRAKGAKPRRWPVWAGALLAGTFAYWLLAGFDYERFFTVIRGANLFFFSLVPAAIIIEQLVRAWKWRQLLFPLKPVGTFTLFGTTMASYIPGLAIGFGTSTLFRAWLVGRRSQLAIGTVLASIMLDRLIDGIAFAVFVAAALLWTIIPAGTSAVRVALAGLGVLTFMGAGTLLLILTRYRHRVREIHLWRRLAARLPERLRVAIRGFSHTFAAGIVWPHALWRRAGIAAAALLIKALATTQYLWAGLALGVMLRPIDYVFLMVFLGSLVFVGFFARIPGSGFFASVFALALFGVSKETATVMTLIVIGSFLAGIAIIGGLTLVWQGVKLADFRYL